MLSIKTGNYPTHHQQMEGAVVGFSQSKIYMLVGDKLHVDEPEPEEEEEEEEDLGEGKEADEAKKKKKGKNNLTAAPGGTQVRSSSPSWSSRTQGVAYRAHAPTQPPPMSPLPILPLSPMLPLLLPRPPSHSTFSADPLFSPGSGGRGDGEDGAQWLHARQHTAQAG